MDKGIIYLIQPADLYNTNRFKIGCSGKNNLNRIKNYGDDARILLIIECNNPFLIEKQIIKIFSEKFKLIRGREYFEGDEKKIKKEFKKIIDDNEEDDVESKESKDDDLNQSLKNPFANIGTEFIVNLFYSLYPHKYLFNKNAKIYDNWWQYNDNNLLNNLIFNTTDLEINIKNDAKKYLTNILKEILTKYGNESEIYNNLNNEYLLCYQQIETPKFIKDVQSIISNKYLTDKDFDFLVDANQNLLSFNNCLYDHSIKRIRKIKKNDYVSLTTNYDLKTHALIDNYGFYSFNKNEEGKINLTYDKEIRDNIFNFISGLVKTKEEEQRLLKLLANFLISNKENKIYIFTGISNYEINLLTNLLNTSLGNLSQAFEKSDFINEISNLQYFNTFLEEINLKKTIICCDKILLRNLDEMGESGDYEEIINFDKNLIRKTYMKLINKRNGYFKKTLVSNKKKEEEYINSPHLFNLIINCSDKSLIKSLTEDLYLNDKIILIKFPYAFVKIPKRKNEKKININFKNLFNTEEYKNEFMLILLEILINSEKSDDIKEVTNAV